MVHVAFLLDPIDGLDLKKDSSLAMIRAAIRRGWRVSYLRQEDLSWKNNRPIGRLRTLTLDPSFLAELDPTEAPDDWYHLSETIEADLASIDLIMMRKDPPFDLEYIYTTYFLERAESLGVRVVNKPASLRDCNEKFFATQFPEFTPPCIVSRDTEQLIQFHSEQGEVVFKPLDGMGGANVFRIGPEDPNLRVVIENLTDRGRKTIMAQRYLPEITDGDKRILLINGKPIEFALARIPMAGEARGNLAAGGTGVGRELTERVRFIANALGPELKRLGLIFVGIDVIGDYLTEVNVTCPTCIRELDSQFSIDIGGMLMDELESVI